MLIGSYLTGCEGFVRKPFLDLTEEDFMAGLDVSA